MKALLMHPSRDFVLRAESSTPGEEDIVRDLELATVFSAMAGGDSFLLDVARTAFLHRLTDPETIRYRQHILADFLRHPEDAREMYAIAAEAVERQKRTYFSVVRNSPDAILGGSIRLLASLVPLLRRLRDTAGRHREQSRSEGLRRFTAMLADELSDGYLDTVESHIRRLDPRRGVTLDALLGELHDGVDYAVRRPRRSRWRKWVPSWRYSKYSFQIPPRDDAAARALANIRGRGINRVADALAQSADHIRSFFRMLRTELGFYVACLNLHERLEAKGEPTCFPVPTGGDAAVFSATGLYDVSLTLTVAERVVGNTIEAGGKSLIFITGANRGGKSTFLRSVGQAQLMMQAGMFAPAGSLRSNVSTGLFTHYKREEDPTMEKGKLEEELSRMQRIADGIGPTDVILCNESFASTNEREGSEIARQIVRAMTQGGVKVFYVTHLYALATAFHAESADDTLFLRAERGTDARRTFELCEGEPRPTSFGGDVYRQIFGGEDRSAAMPAEETEGANAVDSQPRHQQAEGTGVATANPGGRR